MSLGTQKRRGIALTVALVVTQIFLFAWYANHKLFFLWEGGFTRELTKERVVAGASLFQKRLLYRETKKPIGTVTDLEPDWPYAEGQKALAVVGTEGATFVSADGSLLKAVRFQQEYWGDAVILVRLDSAGSYGFLNRRESWGSPAGLFDSEGRVKWTYGGPPGVDDVAAGDVDGDGKPEFVVGFNGDGGIHMLDFEGKKIWQRRGGNVWHVEIVHASEGRPAILHSGSTILPGGLTVLDQKGDWVRTFAIGEHISQFTVCSWGKNPKIDRVLIPVKDELSVYSTSGKKVASLPAPWAGRFGSLRGTPVLFSGETHFATLVLYPLQHRSLLYIHNGVGDLLYEEILADECGAVAAAPGPLGEKLLVGCHGKVWEYSPAKPAN